jgi:hypothetical protein
VVAVHDALATPQLVPPEPVVAAYREVVRALVATFGCLNQQLAARFADHRDAAIIPSQPRGARVLAEFGDDPHRYQTAEGRKASPAPPR